MLKSHCPTLQKKWCRQKRKADALHSQRHSAGTEEVARLNEKPGSRNTYYSSSRGTHILAWLPSIENLLNTIIIIFSSVINLRERFAFPHSAKLMAPKQMMSQGQDSGSWLLAPFTYYLTKCHSLAKRCNDLFPSLVERFCYASTPLMCRYGLVSPSFGGSLPLEPQG